MVDFHASHGFGKPPLLGPPKTLSSNEIADLFADLAKLHRRDKAATMLVTALRKRLDQERAIFREAAQAIEAVCSFLATIEGGEAAEQRDALMALSDKLRLESRKPETVEVATDPLPGLERAEPDVTTEDS